MYLAPVLVSGLILAALIVRDLKLADDSPSAPGLQARSVQDSAETREIPASDGSLAQLFGEVVTSAEPRVVRAPPTRLDLVLKATFTHETPERSYALIGDANDKARSVTTGEEVAPDVLLKSVETGYVVLSRNGMEESLYLPILGDNSARRELAAERPPASEPPVPTAPANGGRSTVSRETPAASPPDRSSPQPVNEQAELRRQKLMERLQALRNR